MPKRLKERIALITGASRGIGAATAIAFAKEGAHTILLARNKAALEDLDDKICSLGGTTTLVAMDLTIHDDIDTLGNQIFDRWGRLDVLVGNAAMLGNLSPVGHIGLNIWDETFAVNVTANWRLIRSMDPLLRRSDAGRGIFITSSVTRYPRPYWGLYTATKAALEAIVTTYAKEVDRTSLRINLFSPGPTRTNLRAAAFPGENPALLQTPDKITETIIRMSEATFTKNGICISKF